MLRGRIVVGSKIAGTESRGTFLAAGDDLDRADGVLLGCPLDDTGSFRPGSRFAPASLRTVSVALEEYSLSSKRDLRELFFFDAGDLTLAPGNTEASLGAITHAVSSLLARGKKPFLMGGEHLVTYGAVRGCLQAFPELTVLYLDAHADMRPSYMGALFSHASVAYYLRRLKGVELFQFGIRSADREEARGLADGNVFCFSLKEPLAALLPLLQDRMIYLSLDIDVVDPAFAPGVTAPEPGGITSGELLEIFPLLEGLKNNIIAFDLVEICPPYDPSQITALLGAKIIREALLTFL
ncbi:MAG TPA: agmatinase [Firmicutes bacterium]|nr:agmatinase [Bacillota bacterium]